MARKTDAQQDKYDNLLLSTITGIDRKVDKVETKVDQVAVIAKDAHFEAKEASKQATITNSRVTHTEENIKQNLAEAHRVSNGAAEVANRSKERLDDLEKIIIPNKPPEPEKYPPLWRDSRFLKIITYISLAFLLLVAAATRFDLKGLL